MTIVSCTDFIVLAITCQAVRQVLCNIIQDTIEQLLFATNFQEVYQSPMIANMRIIFLAANWSLAYGCKNKTPVWLKLNREKKFLRACLSLVNHDIKLSQMKVGIQYMIRFYIMIMISISNCVCDLFKN